MPSVWVYTGGAPALGSCTLTLVLWMKWVVIMKNTSIISTTSTREIRFSSGSSQCLPSRSLTVTPALPIRGGLAPLQGVHEPHGLPLHAHHQILHASAEVAMRHVGRDGDGEANHGGDERLGDAAGERRGVPQARHRDGRE